MNFEAFDGLEGKEIQESFAPQLETHGVTGTNPRWRRLSGILKFGVKIPEFFYFIIHQMSQNSYSV